MSRLILMLLALALGMALFAGPAAADRFYAYNETSRTDFKGVFLAPAGTQNWSPDQAANDNDHSLDTSERLTLTGLQPGHYDVRLVAKNGRTCLVKNVDLVKERSFVLRDSDLKDCQ